MIGNNQIFPDRVQRRNNTLIAPDFFDVAIGATSTTIYTGRSDRFFLIRKIVVINNTGGAINLAMTVNSNPFVPTISIPANTGSSISELEGYLLDVSEDIAATGQNLRIRGWGVMVFGGGDLWTL